MEIASATATLSGQQEAGRESEEVMVMSSADGILGCISAGLGYTIIGKSMVVGSRYEESLAMHPVSNGPKHKKMQMSPRAMYFRPTGDAV